VTRRRGHEKNAEVSGRRVLFVVVAASALGMIPTQLVGTLAIPMRRELGFDEAALGLLVSARAVMGAALSFYLGRFAQRLGPRRAVKVALLGAGGVGFGVAVGAHTYWVLVALMMAAGAVHALSQPASDLWIVRGVAKERHGLAFGIKQAAMPAASLLAGLAVPIFAVTLGWRWAFAAVGLLAVSIALTIPGQGRRQVAGERGSMDRRGDAPAQAMAFLVVGMALAAGPPNAMTTFLVSALVEAGTAEVSAGLVFAVGAVGGVLARLGFGYLADRSRRPQLPIVIAMLLLGAFGYVMLATMRPGWMVAASPVVFVMAWGWPGLFVECSQSASRARRAVTSDSGWSIMT
jgi:predicted MFS family arabinose efflux permease